MSSMGVTILKGLNRLFKLPSHPFNMQNDGIKTYAEWQFEKGSDTIKFFLEKFTTDEMFKDKIVLDIGCGAAGKTLYYAKCGVTKIYGLDVVSSYEEQATDLADIKGLSDKFEYVIADGRKLPFGDNTFDSIIMNDSLEHVDDPAIVISECHRVLKKGGVLYANFPPYYHPYGAHLSDAIGMPWVQMFFSDETLIETYKDLVRDLPDGQNRINFRISKNKNGKEYFSYINRMTIKKFHKIMVKSGYDMSYYKEIPLRSFFAPLAKLPILKEIFVKMVVLVIKK